LVYSISTTSRTNIGQGLHRLLFSPWITSQFWSRDGHQIPRLKPHSYSKPRHLKSALLPGKRRATPQPIAPMNHKKPAHAICRCRRGSSNTGKETAKPTERGEKVVKREPSFTKVCPDELVAYSSFCDEHPWVFRVVLKLGAKTVNILLEGPSILCIPRSPYAVQ